MVPSQPNVSTLTRCNAWATRLPWRAQVRVEGRATYRSASFSVSGDGGLAFSSGSGLGRLTWVDRTGKQLSVIDQADRYFAVELSRDGTQAALEVLDDNGIGDTWTLDLERGVRQLVTRTRDAWEYSPQWSPDGQYIAYSLSLLDGRSWSVRRSIPAAWAPRKHSQRSTPDTHCRTGRPTGSPCFSMTCEVPHCSSGWRTTVARHHHRTAGRATAVPHVTRWPVRGVCVD